jgi:ribosomal protein S18 acetylase RimI-like enzyme
MLKAKNHSKEVAFYLIGILPEYQSKGVTAIIFDEYYKTFSKKGILRCIRTPELEENHAIHNLWKNFDSKVTRRRRTFRKNL